MARSVGLCRWLFPLAVVGAVMVLMAGPMSAQQECPPPGGVESHPMTESFFDVIMDGGGGMMGLVASGPTVIRRGDPVGGSFEAEIVSMDLMGDSEMGPFVVTLSGEMPSKGVSSGFELGPDGCYAIDSFFDVFFEITFPEANNLTLFNPPDWPLRLIAVEPVPIPHFREFTFVQDPDWEPPILVDKATEMRFGWLENTKHVIPARPCPCFPPAGRDFMYSRLGHTLDIPGLGIFAPLMTGPTVVVRSDPYVDPTSGLCTIDTEIELLDLWGHIPGHGAVHITLNQLYPSTGYIRELTPGTCFRARSCFNVFIRVELVDEGVTLVNCKPIVMCCIISALPPFGCPYAVQDPPVELFKEEPGGDVCLEPPAAPAGYIREAFHTPEPEPPCPPDPVVKTSESKAEIVVELPDGTEARLELYGPTTTEIKPVNPQTPGVIPIEIVSMSLVGDPLADPRPTPVTMTLNRRLPSRGEARNCRKDERYGDTIADSFFDVFVEVTLPDPADHGEVLVLQNPEGMPVHMVASGMPLLGNRPLVLQMAPGPAPIPLVDPDGNQVAVIRDAIHRLPPPPPPKCDCYPRSGLDKFRSKLIHNIDLTGIGEIRADLSGPVVVWRSDPYLDPETGLCVIDTIIQEMKLTGVDPLVGNIVVTLSKIRPSIGTVNQMLPDDCWPSRSCFWIYIEVHLVDLGITLVNCDPIVMCTVNITALPPFGNEYILVVADVPLYKELSGLRDPALSVCNQDPLPPPVGFIKEATHTPEPPADECECYPPAGRDVMNSNLWHEIFIDGLPGGVCRAPLRGQVIVDRSDPYVDPDTGKCTIDTKIASMVLKGTDPVCGDMLIELNTAMPSLGRIQEQVANTCYQADSFFDVYVKVTTDAGVFVNCEPAHMEAVITSIPPYNAFYNLDWEGLRLYPFDPTRNVCEPPLPNPVGSIGKALHVPRDPCDCFEPGTDIMDSTLAHVIRIEGLPLCDTPLKGRVVVERYDPYTDANGLCGQDTEITFLQLTGDCGGQPVRITLNPDRPSKGYIKQLTPEACFDAQSCFQVFIIVEVGGLVLENCEPAVMCCTISRIPPYECAYLLRFGTVLLYERGVCGAPPSQLPPPVGVILEESSHTPKPCPPADVRCDVVDGHAHITVIPDPACPCTEYRVVRGDGLVIPQLPPAPPLVFRDPQPCLAPHTYTARCVENGALSDPVSCSVDCEPCEIESVDCQPEPPGQIRVKWTTTPPNCCFSYRVDLYCDGNPAPVSSTPVGGAATEVVIDACPLPCDLQTVCVVCIGPDGTELDSECCELPCAPCPAQVRDLKCTSLEPVAKGVRLTWTPDPVCPCPAVAIYRNGVNIAVVPAPQGQYTDSTVDCPPVGPVVEYEYCVVCVVGPDDLTELGPRVCCPVLCGGCPERQVRNLNCTVDESVDPPEVVITWTQDPACPCSQVRITRDGNFVADVDADAEKFTEDCIPGPHTYCLTCIDASGAPEGPEVCCEPVTCPEECQCPPAGIDRFRASLVHGIDIPGLGLINASMAGPTVVSRSDPYINDEGFCCIKTVIERMYLYGTDPIAGRIIITLNPCRPSEGTICQKNKGPDCFPAKSRFDVYIRVMLPDLGLVLVNCEPIIMSCDINDIPPYGCPYGIENVPVPLYKEILGATAPCLSICDLPEAERPPPVGSIVNASHTPEPPSVGCDCFPPAGRDVMDSNLWHEIVIPGVGTITSGLRGQVVVDREDPIVNSVTGQCEIPLRMASLNLKTNDPIFGDVTISLNNNRVSTGRIIEQEPGTCFPSESFFDVFVEVETDIGTYVNCRAAHMEATITSIPPYNAVYNLDLEGLELYEASQLVDVCVPPLPNPVGEIGRALHVPRDPCDCFEPGTDIMDSTLAHVIDVQGVGLCDTPLRGRLVVERYDPTRDADGLCRQDTEITFLELTGDDPGCGPIKIYLNPDRPSKGYIKQLSADACFPSQSCFQVFIIVEVGGLVLENCEPAVMCCTISRIPPYECAYLLKFGTVALYELGACAAPAEQRPPQVGEIRLESAHTPRPCPPLEVRCGLVDGHAHITVVADPDCPCTEYEVVREDGLVIPPLSPPALPRVFRDPEPCQEPHTYTVRCKEGDAQSADVTCDGCLEGVIFRRGDCLVDGTINLGDVIAMLMKMFETAQRPFDVDCMDACDFNDDSKLNLADVISGLKHIFTTAKLPQPAQPFPDCGLDPTPNDGLDCGTYDLRHCQ